MIPLRRVSRVASDRVRDPWMNARDRAEGCGLGVILNSPRQNHLSSQQLLPIPCVLALILSKINSPLKQQIMRAQQWEKDRVKAMLPACFLLSFREELQAIK